MLKHGKIDEKSNYHNTIHCKHLGKVLTITAPPDNLELHPFYKKYLDCEGLPIISSLKVRDEAFCEAYQIVRHMLKKIPHVKKAMVEYRARIGILALSEGTTHLPENNYLALDTTLDWDDRSRGMGGGAQCCPLISGRRKPVVP